MLPSFFIFTLLVGSTVGLNNGVANTPPMGWNPYNAHGCDTNEEQYRTAAQALVKTGLRDLGYKYLNTDCGWQSDARTASGVFMWNATRIPSGIPALADYVHSLGLSFGLYSDVGYKACDTVNGAAGWIGSRDHEQSDAKTFEEWGADYLKYDNCYAVSPDVFADYNPPAGLEQKLYKRMRDALSDIRSDMVYSICEWGVEYPASWAPGIGNSWRASPDVSASFQSLRRIMNQLVPIASVAAPGGFNDLDLLEVGNAGLTQSEWETQFAFWSAAKSPLLISTDLTSASEAALNILKNERIIKINQDPLGTSIAFKRRYTDDCDVWAGSLADHSMAVVIVNWMNVRRTITFKLADVGLTSADITDLWSGDHIGTVNAAYTTSVEAHGSLIYKLSKGVQAESPKFKTYLATARSSVLAGGAARRTLSDGSTVVSNIGYDGTLTFVGIDGGSDGGTKLLSLSYVNADATIFGDGIDCPNCRRVEVSVNGGKPVVAEMPLSGPNWDSVFHGYLLSMEGFKPGPNNRVTLANPISWAADMQSLGVQA